MKGIRIVATAVAAAVIAGGGLAAAAPAAAVTAGQLTGAYVALGDSYAAGNAAGAYLPDSGECHRSTNAYPAVWAKAYPGVSSVSFACSGATTETVLTAGASAAQVDAALASATKVTLTAGGNDIGFGDAITACLFASDQQCAGYLQTTVAAAVAALPAKLDRLYAAVKARAPHAAVEIVGYPRLMETTGTCAWSVGKRQTLNGMADLLSDTISSRAAVAGFAYRDVRADFAGHGVCSSAPWINDVGVGASWEWMHPNAAGHARTAALVAAPQPPVQISASGGRLTVSMARGLHASSQRTVIWVNGRYVGETHRGSSYYATVSDTPTAVAVVPLVSVRAGDRVQVGVVPGVPGDAVPNPSSVSLLADTQVDSVYSAALTGDGRVSVHLATALFQSSGQVTLRLNGTYRGSTESGMSYYLGGYGGADGVHLTTDEGGFSHGDHVTITLGSQPIYDGVL